MKISENKKIIVNKKIIENKKIGGNYCQEVLNHKRDKIYWKIIQGDENKNMGWIEAKIFKPEVISK